ncbi:glycoside hydrolase family 32 protein [Oceanobacillus damuensis]|uniref:glycoside hydrolase family 32 protein n=1 Tax=Oceanobacillus damuensis TaxID=937928 RepID=UPI00082EC4B5|nr:sucrose-6-phosphate hydrolase [Oceanobacillus damuensis]
MTKTIFEIEELITNRIKEIQNIVADDPYRLHYHLMPQIGLLNDPNGFAYFNGCYHIFYQWNPFETKHGIKYWGHYISDDLVHWKEAPIALAPDQWYDKNGCYSGSAVVHDNKLYLFYTGNVMDDDGNRESYQCLAVSEDGLEFHKRGPIIHVPEGYTPHFRDPKVFCEAGKWYMVVGAQTTEGKGEVVLYTSTDLDNWTFHGPLAGSGRNGLGDFGYMWECPDVFRLDGQDILIICPQGLEPRGYEFNNIFHSGYFSGKVDYEQVTFEHGRFTELDRGFDFYAPQTMIDDRGRRLMVGWMGNAEEGESIHPTTRYEWIHTLTLPRHLEWKDGKLLQNPVEELQCLRENEIEYMDVPIDGDKISLPNVQGNVLELEITIKELDATSFSFTLGENNEITYDKLKKTFSLKRLNLADENNYEKRSCVLNELNTIRLFKDTSSVEIFINNGEEVFSARIFDYPADPNIHFSANGNVSLDIKKWSLKKLNAFNTNHVNHTIGI